MPIGLPSSALHRDEVPRRDLRKNLFLTATLVVGGASLPVRVRNLSASGALVEAANLPASGGAATLRRGSLYVACQLVWRSDGRGGLKFAGPIDLSEWIPGAWGDGQVQVDRAMADVRAGNAPIQPAGRSIEAAAEIGPDLLRRTADELAFVSRRLEALGNALTNDTHVVMRHATSLQELDISMQVLGHLARILVAERPNEAVNAIGMTELRRRLQRSAPM